MDSWVGRLLLATFALAVGLALAEVGARLLWTNPAPPLFTVTEREFDRVPGIFSPGQKVEVQAGTPFAHVVTIDSLGYRGLSFPRAKQEREFRIVFAGDSFTWGHNVDDHETSPALLQTRLSHRCAMPRVINAGLPGSTILAQEAMITRSLTIDPDLVVLMFHENDIDELILVRAWEQLAENRRIKSAFPVSVVYTIVRRSRLWGLAQHLRRTRRAAVEPQVVQGARDVDRLSEVDVDRARDEYVRRLVSVSEILAGAGIPLVFAAFPHPNSVVEEQGGPHFDWVIGEASSLGLPTVDLLDTLLRSEMPLEGLYLVPQDYHPGPQGHAVAAAQIAEVIFEGSVGMTCMEAGP